jgi:hypothetical protein
MGGGGGEGTAPSILTSALKMGGHLHDPVAAHKNNNEKNTTQTYIGLNKIAQKTWTQ